MKSQMSSTSADWLLRARLNLRQLALLVSLDERRSILHAASATHLTQPAASKLLSALESSFGVKLFVRHPLRVLSFGRRNAVGCVPL